MARMWMPDGRPTKAMQRWWERVCEETENARSRMDDIPTQTIYADHTGTVNEGQLPLSIAAKRYFQETDVTLSTAWSIAVRSGAVTVTINATTGAISLTAVTAATSVVRVTSVRGGLTLYKDFTVDRSDSPPPSSGSGGGTSASDSTFNSINSATHAAISDELTVTTGTAGQVALSAPLRVSTAQVAPEGTFEVYGKWQWWDGAAWADVAAEVASNPDPVIVYDADLGEYIGGRGDISVSATKTGLAASSSHKFRLMARNASGTRVMYFSGTASAVGS